MNFIDMVNFLRNFYGISNSSIHFNKIKHDDITYLFPFIKSVNIDEISIEDIMCGNIIGVYDNTNLIKYYVNPKMVIDTDLEINDEEIEEDSISIKNIDTLSKKELLKLRRKLRKLGYLKEAYRTTKLIRKLKENAPKEYYEKKEKLKIKERSNYD